MTEQGTPERSRNPVKTSKCTYLLLFTEMMLELDSQSVGHAVDEREVRGDLADVEDRSIVEPDANEGLDILRLHGPRRARQLVHVFELARSAASSGAER